MKKYLVPFVWLALLGCQEGTLKFNKEIKKIRGDWEMVYIEPGQDKVIFYPKTMKVAFADCADNENNCEATLTLDKTTPVKMRYKMGEGGSGGIVLTHHSHKDTNADSLVNAFVSDIQWFVNTSDKKEMKISNRMIGYRLTLKKL